MTSLIETIKSMVAKVYQGHANADEILYFPVKDYEYGTLLHYAVEFSLQTEVIQLLIAGCNTTIKNNKNLTAEDLAIENGNQQLIQFFQRFTKYRNKFNISHSITYDETLFTNHHHHNIVGLTLGCVYDDYIDWNNTTRTRHLQNLLYDLKQEEMKLLQHLNHYDQKRNEIHQKMLQIRQVFYDKQQIIFHQMKSANECEKQYRSQIDRLSQKVYCCKRLIHYYDHHIYWQNYGFICKTGRLYSNSWHMVWITVSGSALNIYDIDEKYKCLCPRQDSECKALNDLRNGKKVDYQDLFLIHSIPLERILSINIHHDLNMDDRSSSSCSVTTSLKSLFGAMESSYSTTVQRYDSHSRHHGSPRGSNKSNILQLYHLLSIEFSSESDLIHSSPISPMNSFVHRPNLIGLRRSSLSQRTTSLSYNHSDKRSNSAYEIPGPSLLESTSRPSDWTSSENTFAPHTSNSFKFQNHSRMTRNGGVGGINSVSWKSPERTMNCSLLHSNHISPSGVGHNQSSQQQTMSYSADAFETRGSNLSSMLSALYGHNDNTLSQGKSYNESSSSWNNIDNDNFTRKDILNQYKNKIQIRILSGDLFQEQMICNDDIKSFEKEIITANHTISNGSCVMNGETLLSTPNNNMINSDAVKRNLYDILQAFVGEDKICTHDESRPSVGSNNIPVHPRHKAYRNKLDRLSDNSDSEHTTDALSSIQAYRDHQKAYINKSYGMKRGLKYKEGLQSDSINDFHNGPVKSDMFSKRLNSIDMTVNQMDIMGEDHENENGDRDDYHGDGDGDGLFRFSEHGSSCSSIIGDHNEVNHERSNDLDGYQTNLRAECLNVNDPMTVSTKFDEIKPVNISTVQSNGINASVPNQQKSFESDQCLVPYPWHFYDIGRDCNDEDIDCMRMNLTAYIEELKFKLACVRNERKILQSSLEDVITSREQYLECLQWLTSMGDVVIKPPAVPTREVPLATLPALDQILHHIEDRSNGSNRSTSLLPGEASFRYAAAIAASSTASLDHFEDISNEVGTRTHQFSLPTNSNVPKTTQRRNSRKSITLLPPVELEEDYSRIMTMLEELWDCEMGAFLTRDRLYQSSFQRQSTEAQLQSLQSSSLTNELYDVKL